MQATMNLFAEVDIEYKTRIQADRCTLEFASRKAGTLETFEDSPLFGGNRQQDLFGEIGSEPAGDQSDAAELASLEQAMYDRAHVDPKEYSRWLDARV